MPYKLGRHRPPPHHLRLSLRNYLSLSRLPSPPSTTDYAGAAGAALGQMYLNDKIGDCCFAGAAHLEGIWTANAGTCVVYPDSAGLGRHATGRNGKRDDV